MPILHGMIHSNHVRVQWQQIEELIWSAGFGSDRGETEWVAREMREIL